MTPDARLRLLADWCERHAIEPEDVVSIGIGYLENSAHIEFSAGRRLFAGQTHELSSNGHVRAAFDGVEVTFRAETPPQSPRTVTLPELETVEAGNN